MKEEKKIRRITVANCTKQEADAIGAGLADNVTRATVITIGLLSVLPSPEAKRRVLQYVVNRIREEGRRRK